MTEHLRELAELAAVLDHNEHPEWYSSDYLEGIGVLSYPKNARFMAAASPAAVLALITEIGRLTACLKTANSNHEKFERKWYLACDERDALKLDAGRYKWLQENHKSWSWNPSQYAAETTSGFAALCTGYLGYGFTDAVDAAMKEGVAMTERDESMNPGWVRAADDEMIGIQLGVANLSDSYESAKAKLKMLIDWHVAVAIDPKVNGGYQLVPVEPTGAMLNAGWNADRSWQESDATDVGLTVIYKAMLQAAKGEAK